MVSSQANYHRVMTLHNEYNDLMTKCINDGCSYYFLYMGRSEACESCRGLN